MDVRLADKGFKYYDELIRHLTESFLAGEFIDANPDSIRSPSNALTVLVWKVWNLEKRRDLASPFDPGPEQDLSVTRKTSQAKFQLITNKQTNKRTNEQTNKQTNTQTKKNKKKQKTNKQTNKPSQTKPNQNTRQHNKTKQNKTKQNKTNKENKIKTKPNQPSQSWLPEKTRLYNKHMKKS